MLLNHPYVNIKREGSKNVYILNVAIKLPAGEEIDTLEDEDPYPSNVIGKVRYMTLKIVNGKTTREQVHDAPPLVINVNRAIEDAVHIKVIKSGVVKSNQGEGGGSGSYDP